VILAGKKIELIVLVALVVFIYINILWARRGKIIPKIRAMPALQAMREVIGRAAEEKRAVHISTGLGGLADEWAPMTIAAMSIFRKVARYCGEFGVRVKYFCILGHMLPPMQDLIKGGYALAGRPELYSDDMVEYVGEGQQRALMAAMMGYITREKPAVNVLLGAGFYETYISLGCGAVAGSLQIAGTPRLYYQGILIALADYTLIGQELYAAAASITENPPDLGGIKGQDWGIYLAVLIMIITAILATAKLTVWADLLRW